MTEFFFIFLVSGRKYHNREDRKLRQTSREKREANRRLDDLIRGGYWLFPVEFVCEIKRMDTRQVRGFAGTPGTSFYTLKHKEGHKEAVLGEIRGGSYERLSGGFDP